MVAFLPFNQNIYLGFNENEIINLVNDQKGSKDDFDTLEMCFTIYVFTICSLTAAYIYLFFIL